MSRPALDLDAMSRDERLHLLEEVWDSLSREADAIPLTEEQRDELDRRLDAVDQEGAIGVPGDALRARLQRSPR